MGLRLCLRLDDSVLPVSYTHLRPNATDEEIEAACREANCDGFIRKMEKRYDRAKDYLKCALGYGCGLLVILSALVIGFSKRCV